MQCILVLSLWHIIAVLLCDSDDSNMYVIVQLQLALYSVTIQHSSQDVIIVYHLET